MYAYLPDCMKNKITLDFHAAMHLCKHASVKPSFLFRALHE